MTIDARMNQALAELREARGDDIELRRFEKFLRDKVEEGVVVKREYDLPQLDTVGRHLFSTDSAG